MQHKLSDLYEKPISGEWGTEPTNNRGVKVLRTTNFTNIGRLDMNKEVVLREIDDEKIKMKKLQVGDIIIEKSGGSEKQLVGRVVYFDISDGTYLCNNFTSILRPKPGYHSKFLLYLMLNLYNANYVMRYQNKTTGIINLKLNNYLNDTTVNIPSLEIQKKIADALDKAQELIDKRKQQIEMLDEFLQSVFLDMFGDPLSNPKGWEVVPVIKVCDYIVPGRDKPKSFTGNIPWVTTADLDESYYTYNSKDNIGLKIEEVKQVRAKVIPKESVLLTCVGDLGVTSIAGVDMVINQQLHSFQCSERVNNKYLKWMLPYRKDYMYKMATSTTVPYLNKDKCNSIPIMIPPLDIQENFAELVDKIEQQKQLFRKSLSEMQNAFNSIMQKAFRGELFN